MSVLQRMTGLVLAVLLILAGSGVAAEADAPCAQAYQQVLDRYYALLTDKNAQGTGEGETGVWEAALYPGDTGGALDSIGYALQDMSGDGVAELLIGAITHRDDQLAYGSEIFAMYACIDSVPTLTFEGWARSRYYTAAEGTFFYQGSNSASFSLFGSYTLSPDGARLVCRDLYFTCEKPNVPDETALYHSQTGSAEPADSEELTIPEEQFRQLEATLESQVRPICLIPFSQYTPSSPENGGVLPLQVCWPDKMPDRFDTFGAPAEGGSGILFTASGTVKDFRLLTLTLADADSEGKITFRTEEVYYQQALTPERPLLAYPSFYGDIPNNGVSFVDEQGNTRYFAISISGRDGSLELVEFWK